VDRERALFTQQVRYDAALHGVEILEFPPGLGHLMNPCDNYFHSYFKARYWNRVAQAQGPKPFTFMHKVALIEGAYYDMKELSIVHVFKHCGLIGDEDPAAVIDRLLAEGTSYPGYLKAAKLRFDNYALTHDIDFSGDYEESYSE